MDAEFWLGFACCGLLAIGGLVLAAFVATRSTATSARLRAREDHPSYGIAHMKVVDPIDLPLPPRDGIRPIREAARKEEEDY